MEKYYRDILDTPPSLVTDGKFNFGTYKKPFNNLNPLDAYCFSFPAPRALKNLRLKEWQAYEMGNKDFFIFTVLYKAKSIALAQFIIYNRLEKKKYLYEKIVPSWSVKLPSSLNLSSGKYSDRNLFIQYNNSTGNGNLNIKIKVKGSGDKPDAEAEFNGFYDFNRWEPIVVSLPFSERRGMYSHKCLMPMTGCLKLGNSEIDFKKNESFMIIDDHKGFYPYTSSYDWVTGINNDTGGALTGFNLTRNQVINSDEFNENCIWIDGRISALPPVIFSRPDGADNVWIIRDSYGMVDIKFFPESQGKVDVNLVFLKSYYRGPMGRFSGFIKDSSGIKHRIENFFGMGEEKKLRM